MAKKDFTANVGKLPGAIEEATSQEVRKERKTYTEEEKQEFLSTLKTSGRKGVKLPRINMAFTPELYDYIRTMSKVSGVSLTEFVNTIIKQYMDEHKDVYEKAKEFRDSL